MYFTLKFTRYTETILYIAFFFPIEKKMKLELRGDILLKLRTYL